MNPLMFSNPYLMAAGVGLTILGNYQAGKAEKTRQQQIAAQQEQDVKMMQLQSEQDHNARQERLSTLLNVNDTIRAFNNRGSNDRSIKALTRTEKKKSSTDDSRARLQSMLGQSRSRFAASDARAAGNQAMRSAFTKSLGTIVGAVDAYSELKVE